MLKTKLNSSIIT